MRLYHIIFAPLLMLFLCSPTLAQQQEVIGEVLAGENGYEIPVEVINKNEEAIKSVTVELIKKPAGLKNVKIEPRQVDTLAVGKTVVFMLQFDVDETAKPQDFAELVFSVEAENAEFDEPQPVVAVAIVKREGYRPLSLRLVSIEATEDGKKFFARPCRFDHKSGDAGFSASCESVKGRVGDVASFGFTQFPLEIVLGQPFEFVADMKWRSGNRESGNCGGTRWADEPMTLSRCVMGNLTVGLFYGWGGNGPVYFPVTDQSGESTVRLSFIPKSCTVYGDIDCSSPEGMRRLAADPRKVTPEYVYTVKVTPTPEIFFSDEDDDLFFHPDFLQSVEGGFIREPVHPNEGIASHQLEYAIKATEEETHYGKTVRIYLTESFPDHAFVALHYRPVMMGGSHIASASPYRHPDSVQNAVIGDGPEETERPEDMAKVGPTEEEGSPDQDAPSSVAGSSQTNTSTDRQSQDSKKSSTKKNDSKVIKTGLDPNKPESINPNHPKIAGIIQKWIGSAEPPINATQGGNTKYEPWGRFVGTTQAITIKVTRKPDDVTGRTPEEYVWGKRDTLDSVDHCTLGEYVTATLGNKSIDDCQGRYKPEVSDVAGMSKEQAETKLSGMGLKTKIGLGNPAATEKDSLTVEKTIPQSGSTVDRGSMVTLVIHPPFVDKRTVPDFGGLTAKEVIDKIKTGGLVPEIKTVKASSADQAGKVASLDPPPGSEVVAGATVFVDVFLPFVKSGIVPDVTGLGVGQAADVVKGAGFKPAFELGAETRDPKKDKTIARQDPEPGTEIVSGSEVKMFVHTLKAESRTIPNLVGMPIAKAKTILEEMGLSMAPELGVDASKTSDTGRVYKQSPESGTEVTAGGAVAVWVYGEYPSSKPVAVVPAPATGKPHSDQASKTVFVLDRVDYYKSKTKSDLCGDDPKCRHRKYRGGAGPEEEYYSISEDEAKYQFIAFRGATKTSDFKITFNFDQPPSRVTPGDTLYLNSTAAATGFIKGKSTGRGFYYYIKKDGNRSATFFKKDAVRIENRELPIVGKKFQGRLTKKSVNEITIPQNVKKELIIGGKHGWDPGLYVEWVYKPSMAINASARSQPTPNLVGMPIAKAKTILEELGLSMAPELGEDASRAGDVGRVYQQSPEPGSAVVEGVSVNVWVYGEYEEQNKTTSPATGVPFLDIPLFFRGKPFDRVELWSDSQKLEILTNKMGRIIRPKKGFLQDSGAFRTINIIYYNKGDKNQYHFTATWLEPDDPIVDDWTVNNYFCKGENGLSVNKAYIYDHLELRMHSNKKAMLINTTAPLKATSSEIDEYRSFLNQIGKYVEPYAKSCE